MLALNARDTTRAIVMPLVLWGGHFLFCYVAVAVACARGWAAAEVAGVNLVHLATGVATALVLGALGWSIAVQYRYTRDHWEAGGDAPDRRRFVAGISAAVGGVSLVGTAWVALPILIVPVCAFRGAGA